MKEVNVKAYMYDRNDCQVIEKESWQPIYAQAESLLEIG